eukprot:CAMPEP_0182442232 /NCGR_PEP_ID=MMETSP1172-20130603/1175_1 /TAXON_ID=708627 /ORGANISM="Timspurckia oligopyrenoides, Strain CCMP3278" /LENGTH=622 /DNA_ID=CAMNT_0024636981 /DNA_START=354 /DNA_END=2222 /DNA_ORIENTATION=-
MSQLLDDYASLSFIGDSEDVLNSFENHELLEDSFFHLVEPELLYLTACSPSNRLTHAYLARKILRIKYQQRCIQCWDYLYNSNNASGLSLEEAAMVLSLWLRRFDFEREERLCEMLRETDLLQSLPVIPRVYLLRIGMEVSGSGGIVERELFDRIEQAIPSSFTTFGNSRCKFESMFRIAEYYMNLDWVGIARLASATAVEAIEQMSVRVEALVREAALPTQSKDELVRAQLGLLNQVFFDEFHFAGSIAESYYEAENSFLDVVAKQRRGIPITLSILYAAVARRGLQMTLLPAQVPAHFHLRVDQKHLIEDDPVDGSTMRDDTPSVFIDVYHGGVLRDEIGLHSFLSPLSREHTLAALEPEPEKQRNRGVLCRMLNNLYHVYATRTQLAGFGVDMQSLKRSTGVMEGVVLQRFALGGSESDLQVLFSLHVTRRDPEVSSYVLSRQRLAFPQHPLLSRNLLTLENLRQGVFAGGVVPRQRYREVREASGGEHGTSTTSNPTYYVGHCVKHKLYAYEGVIVGWDMECDAPEQWIASMNVDSLEYGRRQPFYHVLVDNQFRGPDAITYVAQENIVLLDAPRRIEHTHTARHFAKFDPNATSALCYYPNSVLTSLYPDDVRDALI